MHEPNASRIVVLSPDELRDIVGASVRLALTEVMRAMRTKSVMTEAEAAEYLGFAPNTLRQWRTEGIGPRYCNPTGSVRYRREALDDWLAKGTAATAPHHRPRD